MNLRRNCLVDCAERPVRGGACVCVVPLNGAELVGRNRLVLSGVHFSQIDKQCCELAGRMACSPGNSLPVILWWWCGPTRPAAAASLCPVRRCLHCTFLNSGPVQLREVM